MADAFAYPVVIGDGGSTAGTEGLPALVVGGEPDSLVDWGAVGELRVRAATVRGRMHRADQTPRQDSFRIGLADGRALVLAVADGVSAAPASGVASAAAVELAVDTVVAGLGAGIEPIDWDGCVAHVRARVLGLARDQVGDQGLSASAAADVMATTLTVAVLDLEGDADGSRAVEVMAFGDVGAWVLGAGGSWTPVTPVKNAGSAIAESSVAALPLDYDAPVHAHRGVLRAGEAFFLFSDGIGDPLGAGSGIVGTELAAAWARPPSPYTFAAWTDFARRTHTDDRTAIGVWAPSSDDAPGEPTG